MRARPVLAIGWRRFAPSAALALVVGFNLAFAYALVPPRVLLGGEPIAHADYALHFARVVAARDFLNESGRTWGYDPYFLAGYPMGTLFDVNNKGVELAVLTLSAVGVPLAVAFNTLVFLMAALPALLMGLAARNFGLTPWQQVVSAALALALWTIDDEVGMTWRIGVFASGIAMYALPWSLSCLYRYIESRNWFAYAFFLVSGVCVSLVHPLSFALFYGPVLLYLGFRRRGHGIVPWPALIGFGAAVVVANLFWLVPVLALWHLKTTSGYHWVGDLGQLTRDLFGLRASGLRLLVVLLSAVGLWGAWQRHRREWVGLLVVPAVALSGLGYLGGELPALRELETYRSNLVLVFLLTIPAAAAFDRGTTALLPPDRAARLLVGAVVLLMIVNVTGRNLDALASRVAHHERLALEPVGADEREALAWLAAHADRDRRVLVEHWPLGALTPWYTGLQVIGGPYPLVWMPHNFANFASMETVGLPPRHLLFGQDVEALTDTRLARYLDTYNIGAIVAVTRAAKRRFDSAPGLRVASDTGVYRMYHNTEPSTFFVEGNGVLRVQRGRLEMTGVSRGALVLKYHWAPFLRTIPPQQIQPWSAWDDPVPFIKLPHNTSDRVVIVDDGPILR